MTDDTLTDSLVEVGFLCAVCLQVVDGAEADGPRDCDDCGGMIDAQAEEDDYDVDLLTEDDLL